jgi:hypothetical protein
MERQAASLQTTNSDLSEVSCTLLIKGTTIPTAAHLPWYSNECVEVTKDIDPSTWPHTHPIKTCKMNLPNTKGLSRGE